MAHVTLRRGLYGLLHLEKNCSRLFCSGQISRGTETTAKRTSESNPVNHSTEHVGLFYTIPKDVCKTLFAFGGLTKVFSVNVDTFGETSLMVRKPAVDIIRYMKNADYKKPVIRYVMYGKPGCGKTISLAHVIHYAAAERFVIFHVPWVWSWFRDIKIETNRSPIKEDLYNIPLVAAAWLKHFQSQNLSLLPELDLKLSKDYVWNQREKTEKGGPLSDLIDHGINRVKYASDCIEGIMEEVKLAARQNKCKVLIAVDGFDALFRDDTYLRGEVKNKVPPSELSLAKIFLSAAKQDWVNGAVVVTLDQMCGPYQKYSSHYPISLLGRKGFEHLDPFIPIHVTEFSDKEFHSMLDYYEDRKWLQRKGGRNELSFLSKNNPFTLMNLCASL